MVSILLQRRNIIKCIFKQQLPDPALQIPDRPPVFLHLIAEECAGMPQVGLKNAEFPTTLEDPKWHWWATFFHS